MSVQQTTPKRKRNEPVPPADVSSVMKEYIEFFQDVKKQHPQIKKFFPDTQDYRSQCDKLIEEAKAIKKLYKQDYKEFKKKSSGKDSGGLTVLTYFNRDVASFINNFCRDKVLVINSSKILLESEAYGLSSEDLEGVEVVLPDQYRPLLKLVGDDYHIQVPKIPTEGNSAIFNRKTNTMFWTWYNREKNLQDVSSKSKLNLDHAMRELCENVKVDGSSLHDHFNDTLVSKDADIAEKRKNGDTDKTNNLRDFYEEKDGKILSINYKAIQSLFNPCFEKGTEVPDSKKYSPDIDLIMLFFKSKNQELKAKKKPSKVTSGV